MILTFTLVRHVDLDPVLDVVVGPPLHQARLDRLSPRRPPGRLHLVRVRHLPHPEADEGCHRRGVLNFQFLQYAFFLLIAWQFTQFTHKVLLPLGSRLPNIELLGHLYIEAWDKKVMLIFVWTATVPGCQWWQERRQRRKWVRGPQGKCRYQGIWTCARNSTQTSYFYTWL